MEATIHDMGIRGFIRNTVEAIRRFFNGPETEDNLVYDSGSIPYSDEVRVETVVKENAEETVAEGFFIDPIIPEFNAELVDGELVTGDWSEEELVAGELVDGDWPEGELVDGDWPEEELVAGELVDGELVDGDWSEEELIASELTAGDWSEEESVAGELTAGDWPEEYQTDKSISSGDREDDGLEEEVVEQPFVVEIPPSEVQHRPIATVVELDVLNYPVDQVSQLDDHAIDNHIVEPQRQLKPAVVVELHIINYPMDTEDEIQAYLDRAISIEDSNYQLEKQELEIEIKDVPTSYVEDSENASSVHIQSGGEQVTLASALESLLFVAESPVDAAHLAKILTLPTEQITEALQTLDHSYATTCRGVRIQNHEDKFQLVTAPSAASIVEDFLSFNLSTKLSGPALEALAVIAYRQPVTRAQVEAVRGVDCASVLRSLIQIGLIEESGRLETLGRPILYSVTELFMQHFGLLKMSELPPLELKEENLLLSTIESPEL